jgi:Zinc carboxypeptidase
MREENTSVDTSLAELAELQRILETAPAQVEHRTVLTVSTGGERFCVPVISMGVRDPAAPAVGFFGGVHGLERIGSGVVLACLRMLVARLAWDVSLQRLLEGLRVVFMPVVNPGGMWRGTRANPRGVDLMRNAPVECASGAPFLLGGQRISAGLPWFRGALGEPMEAEAQALCDVVKTELLSHRFSMSVDCHSGFGLVDRLWFPQAHTVQPVQNLADYAALSDLLDHSLIHHRYVFEPQSRHYLAHGDLWDHLYALSLQQPARDFLPLTLEMGSWLWVKKNPRQAFSRRGIFNPLIAHRQQRVLRRHMALLDFCLRAAASHERWRPGAEERASRFQVGIDRWFAAPGTSP